MQAKIKLIFVVALTGLLLVTFSGSLFARTVWRTGTVTKKPWIEKHRYIEVNNIKYLFMPKVRLVKHYFIGSAKGEEEEISFGDIRAGDKVLMRVQGFRVYEFIIEKEL